VARMRDLNLQTWTPSPKAAFHTFRACLRRHRAAYGAAGTAPTAAPFDHLGLAGPAAQEATKQYQNLVCPRRSKSEPPCRLNIEPGVEADLSLVGCG
jgi:hypothetical protein